MAAAARGFKRALRWLPRSIAGSSGREEEDEDDSSERNGLLRIHRYRIVPVTDLDDDLPPPKPSLATAHAEPKTVALKVSMNCHGCARKVEKEISKLEGVVSIKVELEIKKVTVVGNVTPTEVLEAVSKVMKYAQIFVAP